MNCPDCRPITRRRFVQSVAASAAVASLGSLAPRLRAEEAVKQAPGCESLVTQLYKSMKDEQKAKVCFAFDHPLRSKIDNNWHIVESPVKDVFTADQQALIKQIFVGLHSEQHAATVLKQVEQDNADEGGLNGCSVALFGEPGTGKFEWVLSGRHVTRRCDGDSVEGAAFGGPIFYGHAADGFYEKPDHKGSAYWPQALAANEIYKALDAKQREAALLNAGERQEEATKTVDLQRAVQGLPCSDLSSDQKSLVKKTLVGLLAMFRKADSDEVIKLLDAGGGVDKLHVAFYKNRDLGEDGIYDVWQIQGPNSLWFCRGEPHVHVWVHVKAPA